MSDMPTSGSAQAAPEEDPGPTSTAAPRGWLKSLFSRRGAGPSLRRSLTDAIEASEESAPGPAAEADIGDDERMMLKNILTNGRLRVDDVMIPRADIVAFNVEEDFSSLIRLFCEAEHSRLPVYRDSLDDVIGMVHIKDVIKPIATTATTQPTVTSLLRSVLYVPPSMRVMDLLAKMRAGRIHMAIVIDEYGGTDGLVTIEDLVEQFIGDIEDEHDEAEPDPLRRLGAGVYDADARLAVEELEAVLHCDLLPPEDDEDIDTVGGLAVRLAGKVPAIGEVIDHPLGLRFEVVDGDPRRLKRLRIYRLEPESAAPHG
ncbi:MAG: hemolysin family protein [Pseudomonadota bacterium]